MFEFWMYKSKIDSKSSEKFQTQIKNWKSKTNILPNTVRIYFIFQEFPET